ncbi:exported hypothetical protein [metagenome]|uniref:Uncharacterized protein n=1 Tax=metagenome TaxID=256318 RepID=A0A2P2BWT5_9ZZZZ
MPTIGAFWSNLDMLRGNFCASRLLVVVLTAFALVGLRPLAADASVWVDDTPVPGWGVDGRVYATVVVGDTVVVGGSFANAVSTTGTLVVRKNLAAFSMTTGELLTTWNTKGAGSTVYALATDGTSVWVGGSFAKLGGATHTRLGKLNATTGVVDAGFTASADNTVRALALDGTSLYAGGNFLNVNGAARTRLVKVAKTTGALDSAFVSNASDVVYGLARNPVGDQLYASGRFKTIAGAARNGVGAVSATSGSALGIVFASAARPTLGLAINTTGTRLFGAGGSGSNAAAAWDTTNGVRTWRQVTDGDIQAVAYYDNTVYFGFHDGYQTDATIKMLAANAETGVLENFYPRFDEFWGIFAIAVTDRGVVAGGDFTQISGVPDLGFARFPALPNPKTEPVVHNYLDATSGWSYWDQGTRPTNWQSFAFDASSWATGLTQIGYGDGDEDTVVGYGGDPNNRYVTTYMRTHFTVDAIPQALKLQLLADDGAVVYLNGVELVRDNMPDSPATITNTTLAATQRTGGPENAFRPFSLNPEKLRIGDNVLAVEVHQSGVTSEDLSFDVDLSGEFDS